MTASLIVAAAGAAAAAVGTGFLTARCVRTPRPFLIAWAVTVFVLAIALGAQTVGYLAGYTGIIFRCMEIGAQALAPLAVCLGLVELIGRSAPARFAMRLAVVTIGIIVLVILSIDPLGTTSVLSTSWPDPTVFYQLIPVGLIELVAVFTILTALASGIVVLARSGRGYEFAAVVRPGLTAAAGAALVAVPGLMMLANVQLHASVFALTGLLAAVSAWLAGVAAGRQGLLDVEEYGYAGDRRDEYPGPAYQEDDFYRDRWAEPSNQSLTDADDVRYPALAALATGRPGDEARDLGPGSRLDSEDRGAGPQDGEAGAELFGQITIYTLLDDRLEEFDRITERVVKQVRSREPGTLVYIVHAVPTAPMQRILYEVYRDRAAYEEHLAQPYVGRYADERRSMVLATNAIELGLQQAKVTPLPTYSAISDILSESGIDLTGVTRSGRRATAHHDPEPPPGPNRAESQYDAESQYGAARQDSEQPGHDDWSGRGDEDRWYR